jgi:hypothetical protein
MRVRLAGLMPFVLAGACGAGPGGPPAPVDTGALLSGDAAEAEAASGDAAPDAGIDEAKAAPDGAASDRSDHDQGGPSLEELVDRGAASIATVPRSTFGAVIVATSGRRIYTVESRRDVEPGPFGIPWRSRFRLAAYDDGIERWSFAAPPDDVVSDVAVHPSGEVTIAVLHQPPARRAYDLVRIGRDGVPVDTTTLAEPATIPSGDYGSGPHPLFRMKSDLADDATVGGWVRLLPDGEGLVVAFLSHVDVPETDPLSLRMALGLAAFARSSNAYAERWARVVEGPHAAQPAAWAYDELRWREQAIRPFLARDEVTGDLVVGRAWNNSRCTANVAVFAELTKKDCMFGAVSPIEIEWLPMAVTRFTSAGARLGTTILAPDADAAEQVGFALAARAGRLAVAGAVVRTLPGGAKRTYPDPSGYVDYDGYVALYDAQGKPVLHHDFNLGRGDMLAGMRWTDGGIVAVGAAGWDRWQGGMSISRGADPLVAWLSEDGARAGARVLAMSDGARHFNLHDVAVLDGAIVGVGFSDAPMTHSADGGNDAARTFGALRINLRLP